MIAYLAIWSIIVMWLLLGLYGSISERREWNGGVCRQTGMPWEYFDTDSQGGRGYKSGDNVVWVSWPGILPSTRTGTKE